MEATLSFQEVLTVSYKLYDSQREWMSFLSYACFSATQLLNIGSKGLQKIKSGILLWPMSLSVNYEKVIIFWGLETT